MAYATHAQVAGEFKGTTFTASTAPTADQVASFIEEADAEIDAALGSKYAVPITGTGALVFVRGISIALAADRVRGVLGQKTGQDKSEQAGGKSQSQMARERLAKAAAGEVNLVALGATLATSSSGIQSYNSENSVEPVFDRDEEQW